MEAAQIENKINHSEKNQTEVDSLKEDKKEFLKDNNLIVKTQQRFKSESHNVFTKKINKSALGSNDNKRMYSIKNISTCNE